MYVAHLWTESGYRVKYQGILEKFNDLGRDVVAETDTTVDIIQCKCWSKKKILRENSIFQLAGTVFAAQLEEQETTGRAVTGHFVTSTTLSPVAEAFAQKLE